MNINALFCIAAAFESGMVGQRVGDLPGRVGRGFHVQSPPAVPRARVKSGSRERDERVCGLPSLKRDSRKEGEGLSERTHG